MIYSISIAVVPVYISTSFWVIEIRALGFGKKPAAKIVVVGLDNSGKTTILNHLKTDKTKTESSDIVPTGKKYFLQLISKEYIHFRELRKFYTLNNFYKSWFYVRKIC